MKTKVSKSASAKADARRRFIHRIDALVEGKRTSAPDYGVVSCVKAAKTSKNHKRLFKLAGSKVARNRSGYTFTALMEAFGFHR